MKIIFVADVSINKIIGGAERVLYDQTTRLVERGHSVHILTRKLPKHEIEYERISGVNEWRFECNVKNQLLFLLSTVKNGKMLFEKLHNENQFDCINFHQPFSSFGVLQSILSKKIPKFYTCHSLSFEEFISRNQPRRMIFGRFYNYCNIYIRKLIEKKVLTESDRIIVFSQYTKHKLINTYKIPSNKIKEIPGGVDTTRFYPSKSNARIRKKFKLPQNKIILFTVRNLVPRMGLENLIKALDIVVKEAPDVHLLLGGEGPLKEKLLNLTSKLKLEKYISFLGFIKEEQLADYYRAANFFVLPTKDLEGFGLVTIEAMSSGLPVLGTAIGGTKEILNKFDPSFIFKNTDPESISKLILEKYKSLKKSPKIWEQISDQCWEFARTNYSLEFNLDSLENLYIRHFRN